jgi:CotS family spore coat protein
MDMNIREDFCLNPKKVVKTNEGYVLHLSKVKLLLNPVNYKEWEILSSAEAVNHLIERGFTNIIVIRRNKEGKPFIKEGNKLYILTDSIEAPKFKLTGRANLLRMAEVLARFHDAGEGFVQPPGIKIKVSWGKKLEKYKTFASKLERYIDYLTQKTVLNQFEEYTKGYVETLLKQAKASVKVLKSMRYLKRLEESMKRKELCLNTVSNNTSKLIDGKIIIIKVFDISYNMIEEDIASLVKKAVGDTGDKSCLDDILLSYGAVRKLDVNSREIVKALVSFPSDSIKTIIKYMNNMGLGDELLAKFKSYIDHDLGTEIMGV